MEYGQDKYLEGFRDAQRLPHYRFDKETGEWERVIDEDHD
jgi:hypothetical protein